MKNPIKLKRQEMFATPENMEELEKIISSYNSSEAWQAAMFTWNLASKLVDDALNEEKESNDSQ